MSAKPVYPNPRSRESDSQGTLLPHGGSENLYGQGHASAPPTPEVQTLRGNDTRHESRRGGRPVEAFPEARAETFAPPPPPGFLSPPLGDGELGWLAHYRVLRVLGAGGMGLVLEAEDTHLQRRVALKVIRPEMAADASLRQRFLREARAMAAIQNDHLVTIYQVGQDRDTPFLAMQYLQGETLQSRLQREGRLPLSDILRISIEIAEGLGTPHAPGFIHRGNKPANIFLATAADSAILGETTPRQTTENAQRATVKLLDFGLAVPVGKDGQLTGSGRFLGTPLYMAPEQARGEAVNRRSDLFSLGAVLYEMAAGVSPFQASDPVAIVIAVATEEPRPLAGYDSSLPAAFTELVHKLLSKLPDDRPASAQAVIAALQAIECNSAAPRGSVQQERHPDPQPMSSPPRALMPPAHNGLLGKKVQRSLLLLGSGLTMLVAFAAGLFMWTSPPREVRQENEHTTAPAAGEPIRVGILHSLTGELAAGESSVVDATLLAIEGLNEKGGVLGRPILPVLADGRSDEDTFAQEATRLIVDEHVAVIVGCWTSACRKAIKPVIEKHNHLLFYPVYYEGLESSRHIVHTGGTPNQQIIPAVQWSYAFLGKRRFFLAGTDSVYPRTAHALVRERVRQLGGKIVGEEYVAPGATELTALVRKVVAAQPDLIVNSLNG